MNLILRAQQRLTRGGKQLFQAAFQSPVTVLNYHRVGEPGRSENQLSVTAAHFMAQMEYLRQRYEPVSARELMGDGLFRRRKKPPVVVTFDDGYAETLKLALPALERFAVPSTIFVTTRMLEETREFWWDELEYLVFDCGGQGCGADAGEFRGHRLTTEAERIAFYRRMDSRLKHLPLDQVEWELAELRSWRGLDRPVVREEFRALTLAEMREYSKHPMVEFGSHTVNHLCMSTLSAEEQYEEMRRSRERLEALIGMPVRSIAYPFGSKDDFNKDSRRAASRCGYDFAMTTVQGSVTRHCDAYAMPRLFVKNWDKSQFAAVMRRFPWLG